MPPQSYFVERCVDIEALNGVKTLREQIQWRAADCVKLRVQVQGEGFAITSGYSSLLD